MENIEKYFRTIRASKEANFQENEWFKTIIKLNEQLIAIYFQDEKFAEPATSILAGLVVNTEEKPSLSFYCWNTKLNEQFDNEEKLSFGRYNFKGSEGEIYYFTEHFLCASLKHDNSYYLIVEDLEEWFDSDLADCLFEISFAHLLRNNQKYVFHSSCVGINGVGALITGRSGSGKSTLSVSCLMDKEFDFITDEFSIVSNINNELYANPCFRTVSLNQDSYDMLNPEFPIIRHNKLNYNKLTLCPDANLFCDSLLIKYLIIPKVCNVEKPCIKEVDAGKVMVPLVYSTLQLLHRTHDKELVVKYIDFVKNLPTYQISLSRNIDLNKECLKEFLITSE